MFVNANLWALSMLNDEHKKYKGSNLENEVQDDIGDEKEDMMMEDHEDNFGKCF